MCGDMLRFGRLFDDCARLAVEGAALAFDDGDVGAALELMVEARRWADKRDEALFKSIPDDAPIN